MTTKSKVAILRTKPETALDDYQRLFELGGGSQALAAKTPTIIKDNISWHFPMPSANTTPWQLEGTVQALQNAGFTDLSCVQNKTVVIDTSKGEDLNGYVPIFKHYQIPVKYNFKPEDMTWIPFTPTLDYEHDEHMAKLGYLPNDDRYFPVSRQIAAPVEPKTETKQIIDSRHALLVNLCLLTIKSAAYGPTSRKLMTPTTRKQIGRDYLQTDQKVGNRRLNMVRNAAGSLSSVAAMIQTSRG